MATIKKPKPTKAERIEELERKLREASAGLAYVYAEADETLDKASTDYLTASGAVLTLTALGGRVLCRPILIRDGLSKETIVALKADLRRSFRLATLAKPKEPA